MTVNVKALSRYATSDRGGRNQSNFYVYSTEEAVATVKAANYFDDASHVLKKGDFITCVCVTAGTPAPLHLTVTAVSTAGVVTVVDMDA